MKVTPAQVDFVSQLNLAFPTASIEAYPPDDEDCEKLMYVEMTEDGVPHLCLVDTNGTIVGDWH